MAQGSLPHQVNEASDHVPLLQVGLAVQRGRLDVAQAVRIAGAEQQHVGRHDLVAAQPDEVSHADLLPVLLQVAPLSPGPGEEQSEVRGKRSGGQ